MTHIVSIINQKGGVGKTTLTINLGAALSDIGQRVLLIDLDGQGHLTEGIGMHDHYLLESPTLHQALVGNQAQIEHLIYEHKQESLAVVPSNYQLMLTDQALFMARNREHKLKKLLEGIKDRYDWILIDCPPALSNLTDNALNVGREVIVPIQAEATSIRALELLFDQIESIERGLNINIAILAVVPNLVQDSKMAKDVLNNLKSKIPALTPFELRKRVLLQEAWSNGVSVFRHEPRSAAQEKTKAELTCLYRELAHFVIQRAQEENHE